jgi:hypothetical protein
MRQIVRHELRVKIRIHAEEIRSSRLDDLPKLIEVVEDLALVDHDTERANVHPEVCVT